MKIKKLLIHKDEASLKRLKEAGRRLAEAVAEEFELEKKQRGKKC